MTLVSSIITDAYREANIVPITSTPSTFEQAEGLQLLNRIVPACLGIEAGQELKDLNLGGEFDQSFLLTSWAPANARLVLNLGSGTTVKMHPYPYEGQRIAIADALSNLSTNNLILDGNGRRIEDVTSLTLNTDGLSRQWMYRGDTGNWVRITDLSASDQMPFPVDFDDYFVTRLALRLAPRNDKPLPQETAAALSRAGALLRARYRKPRSVQDMGSLGLLGQEDGGQTETWLYR